MRKLLRAVCESHRAGRDCVLCSVVETRGSTPQKPGAAMIAFPDGGQAGTLGGGCVEAEVRQHALKLIGRAEPESFTYTLDDNYGWDDGLICGGRMTFVAQPVSRGVADVYFDAFAAQVDQGSGCTEAVVMDPQRAGLPLGARFLFDRTGKLVASHLATQCPQPILESLDNLSRRPRPKAACGVAFLPILTRCRLVIIGAGHVGQAVADFAQKADFDVWIVDDREKYACQQRFPNAERIIVDDIGRACKAIESDENTYWLIMTRGHSHDEEALFYLAQKPARYRGMIGSRRKIRLIFEDLEKEGIDPDALESVYAPLGIDIGSQTVPEIAISIVAQLIGHRNLGPDAFPPPAHRLASECS